MDAQKIACHCFFTHYTYNQETDLDSDGTTSAWVERSPRGLPSQAVLDQVHTRRRPAGLAAPVLAVLLAGCALSGTPTAPSPPPRTDTLTIADASAGESAGSLPFVVRPSAPVAKRATVSYATEDRTAVAGADYQATRGTLTLAAGATAATIKVPIIDDSLAEDTETFTVTLSDAVNVSVSATAGTAIGTIEDDDGSAPAEPTGAPTEPPVEPPVAPPAAPVPAVKPLGLASLQVTGGGTMFPRFDTGVRHYALPCAKSNTLRIRARAHRRGTRLTLLRAQTSDSHVASQALDVSLAVNPNHDIAIELNDTGRSLLDINMHSADDAEHVYTYRAYRETGIRIPLNLP